MWRNHWYVDEEAGVVSIVDKGSIDLEEMCRRSDEKLVVGFGSGGL